MPKQQTEYFICDVCTLRFRPEPDPEHPEREDSCPRCHTPFIHPESVSPQSRRYGRAGLWSHPMTCG